MDRIFFRIFVFCDAKVGIFEMIKQDLSGRAEGLLFWWYFFCAKKKLPMRTAFVS